jgi:hypothetical protein
MPDWIAPLLALIALLGFLYFAFVRVKPAPRSGNDTHRSHTDVGGGHSGD